MVERFLCSNYTVILCFSNLMSTLENRGLLILFFWNSLDIWLQTWKPFPVFPQKYIYIFVGLNASFCIELNNNKFDIKNIITFHMQLEIFATVFLIPESCIVHWTCTSPSWVFNEDKYSLFIENVGLNKDCFNNHHQIWIICSQQRTGYHLFFKYRTCTNVWFNAPPVQSSPTKTFIHNADCRSCMYKCT